MRFETAPELRLFADSVRGAIGEWEPPREPAFGTWWDEQDEQLATRLAGVGWAELWADAELRGAAVAGAIELGRAVAPLSLVDVATLGGGLGVGGRTRHLVLNQHKVALVTPGGLVLADVRAEEREATLDGTGTVRVTPVPDTPTPDGDERLRAWAAATLGYLAGLAARSLDTTVAYVTSREQFGAPLAALPTMQARLADMSLLTDGLELVAWQAATPDDAYQDPLPRTALAWAGPTAREIAASAHQAHGGVGFALETGVHCAYRRAKSAQVWIDAVLASIPSSASAGARG